ncbi:MAG: sulfite exporter TauE/SafE family protein [Alphaproteobacteria bacterium]|nr:sulfite exporter TauE/SafE family protein [Alphaproteobacteria bacterium]
MSPDLIPAQLIPFQDLDAGTVALLFAIYLVTAVVRGAFGFGGVAPAIVFSSLMVEPHYAILLSLVTACYCQFQIFPFALRHGDWQVAKPMFLSGFLAIALGVFVFKSLEAGWLTICLGVVMAGIVVLDYYKVMERLAERIDLRSTATAFGLSSAAGLIAGVAGGGGMYLYSIYLKYACPTPASMRGTSILLGAIFIYWRFLAAALMALISLRLLIEALIMVPPSLIGAWVGIRFFRWADAKKFYGAFQLVLFMGAAILLWKGLRQVM